MFALNKSDVTRPALEHSAEGAIPEIAQKDRDTTPFGALNSIFGSINSGFTS